MAVLTARRAEMCFCPGCSHGAVLEHLGAAIDALGRRPEEVCLVSDIGCIGMADRYFACHTFHGLHGRSVTYAEGIKRMRPDLLVVVLIGDGGCGIGTAHLIHAARRNADIKVVVCNNFNFGMTGGQHSATTPPDGRTLTTPEGAGDHPFDLCATVAANGAAHVARFSALDSEGRERLEAALRAPGFALIDLWELCTAYYMPHNTLRPKGLIDLSERLGMPFGVLVSRPPAPPTALSLAPRAIRAIDVNPVPVVPLAWPGRTEICLAGSAGQRVRSAAGTLGEIATAGGLHAAQQDDFPVTVQRGHSLSNLIISPAPIRFVGMTSPELVVIMSVEGLRRLDELDHLQPSAVILVAGDFALPPTRAAVQRLDPREWERMGGKPSAALAALVCGVFSQGWIAGEALLESASRVLRGRYRDESLAAIEFGIRLQVRKGEHDDSSMFGG